jgi:hypothetical protein
MARPWRSPIILATRTLRARFQPIVDLADAA